MHRKILKNLLINYLPTDLEEAEYKNEMLHFLNNYPNCFERSCTKGHFTASSWLLDRSGKKALLMHHAKLNSWFQLGGHCDGDHDILQVAIKEAQEESGISNIIPVHEEIFDIDIHLIPENSKETAHYHYDIRFLLKVHSESNEVLNMNQESRALQWFTNQSTLPTNNPSVIRMFNKWIKQIEIA